MKGLKKNASWSAAVLVLLLLLLPAASAAQSECPECPFKIELTVKAVVGFDEPVTTQIRVFNNSDERVITRKGFLDQDFYKWIALIGPDGPIPYQYADATDFPFPSIPHKGKHWTLAEIIPPKGDPDSESLMVFDARTNYQLDNVYGPITAQVLVPADIFKQFDVIPSGAVLADLDDPERCGCNPLASNKVLINLVPPAIVTEHSIHAIVKILTIGTGAKPPVTKESSRFSKVRLYKRSEIPNTPDYYPINWKTYPNIWQEVPFLSSQNTDYNGIAKFENVTPDDYLLLAEPRVSTDFKHLGKHVEATDSAWLTKEPIKKHMMVIVKPDKKKVPGKTTKLKGSELLITQPEFVLWDSTEETYPFIFEAVGDWDVVTEVIPPVGFEPDNDSLDAQVVNEIEAVQFTITDVGTEMKPACVKHIVTHKKNKQTLYRRIGINLTKKLAEEKGIDIKELIEIDREDLLETAELCREREQERREAEREGDEGDKPDKPGKGKKK